LKITEIKIANTTFVVNQAVTPESTAYDLNCAILGSPGTILREFRAGAGYPFYSHPDKNTGKVS